MTNTTYLRQFCALESDSLDWLVASSSTCMHIYIYILYPAVLHIQGITTPAYIKTSLHNCTVMRGVICLGNTLAVLS